MLDDIEMINLFLWLNSGLGLFCLYFRVIIRNVAMVQGC